MRIFFIGFMGAGKSWTGRRLADRLGWRFVDLDELIEQEAGMHIPAIFAKLGEEAFRKIEARTLRSLAESDRVVVATGGGTPCFFDNMQWMNAHGETVYLKTAFPVLFSRLSKASGRPLVDGLSSSELAAFIRTMLDRRSRFYEQAKLVVPLNSSNEDPLPRIFEWLELEGGRES